MITTYEKWFKYDNNVRKTSRTKQSLAEGDTARIDTKKANAVGDKPEKKSFIINF